MVDGDPGVLQPVWQQVQGEEKEEKEEEEEKNLQIAIRCIWDLFD